MNKIVHHPVNLVNPVKKLSELHSNFDWLITFSSRRISNFIMPEDQRQDFARELLGGFYSTYSIFKEKVCNISFSGRLALFLLSRKLRRHRYNVIGIAAPVAYVKLPDMLVPPAANWRRRRPGTPMIVLQSSSSICP